MSLSASAFLTEHKMSPDRYPVDGIKNAYLADMRRALAGDITGVYMLPSYARADCRPRIGENVLVIDAGGSNIRAARAHISEDGQIIADSVQKRRMPGADGTVTVAEMFDSIARFAAPFAEGCSYACISFSYPCEVQPDGDGIILHLSKELSVSDAVGCRVCAGIEAALVRSGVSGHRKWLLINDTVGSLFGGMASDSGFSDYIGLIVGTGFNACCRLPSALVTKSPAAVAMGGEMIVNIEAGYFRDLPTGDIDRMLDESSASRGISPAEKMISGAYITDLFLLSLRVAAQEGFLSDGCGALLAKCTPKGRDLSAFTADRNGDNAFSAALPTEADRLFGYELASLLLRRAAKVIAGCFLAIYEMRSLPAGSRVCISADGSLIRLNPLLMGYIHEEMAEEEARLGVSSEFLFVQDASLLGCAYAGLAAADGTGAQ